MLRQLLCSKRETLESICDSDGLYWYFWRYALARKMKLTELFDTMRRGHHSSNAEGRGLNAAQVQAFIEANEIKHTDAGLRFFLQSLGLSGPQRTGRRWTAGP